MSRLLRMRTSRIVLNHRTSQSPWAASQVVVCGSPKSGVTLSCRALMGVPVRGVVHSTFQDPLLSMRIACMLHSPSQVIAGQ